MADTPNPEPLGSENPPSDSDGAVRLSQAEPSNQNPPAGTLFPQTDGASLASAQTVPVGLIKGTTGDTVITRVDGSTVPGGPRTPVFRGDILATREGASVSISFANNAEFFLGASGRMLVESIAPATVGQEPQSIYFVLHGQFGFMHRSDSFSGNPGAVVRTPVATLQVHNGRVAGPVSGLRSLLPFPCLSARS